MRARNWISLTLTVVNDTTLEDGFFWWPIPISVQRNPATQEMLPFEPSEKWRKDHLKLTAIWFVGLDSAMKRPLKEPYVPPKILSGKEKQYNSYRFVSGYVDMD